MLARLILSLLLMTFTLPAMAASPCHDAPAPMAMAGHHSTPAMPAHQDKTMIAHACIGCIPPTSLKSGTEIGALIQSPEIRIAGFARLNPGKTPAPATPPPRTEA